MDFYIPVILAMIKLNYIIHVFSYNFSCYILNCFHKVLFVVVLLIEILPKVLKFFLTIDILNRCYINLILFFLKSQRSRLT